jgi:hypothetical protein
LTYESPFCEESPFIEAALAREVPDEVFKLLKAHAQAIGTARRLDDADRSRGSLSNAEVRWLYDPRSRVVAFCEDVSVELHQAASLQKDQPRASVVLAVAARLDGVEPSEAKALTGPLADLSRLSATLAT